MKFPTVVIAKYRTGNINGIASKEIVYNETQCKSFLSRYEHHMYLLDEREPKWSELKRFGFFKKIYVKMPKWLFVVAGWGIGLLTSNDVKECVKSILKSLRIKIP